MVRGRSPTEYFYGHDAIQRVEYGKAVIANKGSEVTWADWIDRLASKIPGPADQWGIIQADSVLDLEVVLDQARTSLTNDD